jgi:hypothetical protein
MKKVTNTFNFEQAQNWAMWTMITLLFYKTEMLKQLHFEHQ